MHTGSCPECSAGFQRLLGVETTASRLDSLPHPCVLYLSYPPLHRTLVVPPAAPGKRHGLLAPSGEVTFYMNPEIASLGGLHVEILTSVFLL